MVLHVADIHCNLWRSHTRADEYFLKERQPLDNSCEAEFFFNRTAACGKAGAGPGGTVKAVAERNCYVLTLIPHPTSPLNCLGQWIESGMKE